MLSVSRESFGPLFIGAHSLTLIPQASGLACEHLGPLLLGAHSLTLKNPQLIPDDWKLWSPLQRGFFSDFFYQHRSKIVHSSLAPSLSGSFSDDRFERHSQEVAETLVPSSSGLLL